MKEVISNCEKQFLLQSIKNGKRLDGRGFDEFRELELHFGSDYGCCYATLGETKVLAQVSCSLNEPRTLRPTEGMVFINVEISETVCPQPHLATHANRLLEKCIKESNCVDLESLCLVAAEQVFDIRVDVNVLNFDGNLLTCCSVATLAALGHFRLPAITIEDSEVIVHSIKEKPPVPLSLHHFPILVSFAVFCDGEVTIIDPTELEEKVSEGELVIGMNNYRELCGLHFSGRAIGNKDLILSCSSRAALIAADCVKRLRQTLEEDHKLRESNRGESEGVIDCIHLDRILSACRARQALRLKPEQVQDIIDRAKNKMDFVDGGNEVHNEEQDDDFEGNGLTHDEDGGDMKPISVPDQKGGIIVSGLEASDFGKEWVPSGGKSSWEVTDQPNDESDGEEEDEDGDDNDDDDDDDDDDDVNYVKTITDEDRIIDKIELSGDSEEEDVIILKAGDT